MQLVVYIGTRPAIRAAMRRVDDFRDDPFSS